MPARPEFGEGGRDVGKIEVDRQAVAEQETKPDRNRGIAEKVRIDLIAVEENEQPAILRLQRLIEREAHVRRHFIEVVRNVELEEKSGQDPLRNLNKRYIRDIFRIDLRHEHFGARD